MTRVEVGRDEVGVTIAVEDAGPGFEDTDRAFEEGFQGADGQGALGLGLALVRRIADAHGWRVAAQNRTRGARVVVRIPSE